MTDTQLFTSTTTSGKRSKRCDICWIHSDARKSTCISRTQRDKEGKQFCLLNTPKREKSMLRNVTLIRRTKHTNSSCFCGMKGTKIYRLKCGHSVHRNCMYHLSNYRCKECNQDIRTSKLSKKSIERVNLMKAVELLTKMIDSDALTELLLDDEDDALTTAAINIIDRIKG